MRTHLCHRGHERIKDLVRADGAYRCPICDEAGRLLRSMKARCYNKNHNRFHCYGLLGVAICARWMDPETKKVNITNFLADMYPRPPGTSLDRRNPGGNYEPSNCRWATPTEQANNKRR